MTSDDQFYKVHDENCNALKIDLSGFVYHDCVTRQGMSGGPIFYRNGKNKILVGITSRGPSGISDDLQSTHYPNRLTLLTGRIDLLGRNPLAEIKAILKKNPCK